MTKNGFDFLAFSRKPTTLNFLVMTSSGQPSSSTTWRTFLIFPTREKRTVRMTALKGELKTLLDFPQWNHFFSLALSMSTRPQQTPGPAIITSLCVAPGITQSPITRPCSVRRLATTTPCPPPTTTSTTTTSVSRTVQDQSEIFY